MSIEDFVGKKFGSLIVLGMTQTEKGNRCICLCMCGTFTYPQLAKVISGHSSSCGHDRAKNAGKAVWKHGESNKKMTKEYLVWKNMLQRCRPGGKYFLKGIKMCQEWQGENGFATFLKDMGRADTKDLSLDRIDNTGNYCKENCRWATISQQNRNTSASLGDEKALDVILAYRLGISRTELSKMYGVSLQTIKSITNGKTYKDISPWK